MADRDPRIGKLRWQVIIAQREQAVSGTVSITEHLCNITTVHADIQSLGPMTYLAGEQTDRPITDRIIIRWLDWLDMTYVILRNSYRLDRTDRQELFRIRKIGEWGGRKRFLELLVEREMRT